MSKPLPQHEHLINFVYERHGHIAFRHPEEGEGPLHRPMTAKEALVEVEAVDGGQDFHIFMPDYPAKGAVPIPEDEVGDVTFASTVQLMIGYCDDNENVVDWSCGKSERGIMDTWLNLYEDHEFKAMTG